MSHLNGQGEKHSCPHIDGEDSRCASLFTLSQIDQAFALCLNNHERCSTYKSIQDESKRQSRLINLTCSVGRFSDEHPTSIGAVPAPLQATGT